MRSHDYNAESERETRIIICGAFHASGPCESTRASLQITGDRISGILKGSPASRVEAGGTEIDLSGFLIMPGLINAHDHLEFALFPRLADPPYRDYIEWGEDIHQKFPDAIAKHRAVPKGVRVWWGGIRNLLSGVTTVSHHDPLHPEMRKDEFPVRVVHEYGWAHSVALGGDLAAGRATTSPNWPFIVHACEGVGGQAREELWELDRLGLLDANAVLVHGLAIDHKGIALMKERGAALIVCPSSNQCLFGVLPNIEMLSTLEKLALGNDSPLTAEGDLLDEVRFAIHSCGLSCLAAYRMVTTIPASVLRLKSGEGSITSSGLADLIAVRDTGEDPADRLETLSMRDVEFVMTGGHVRLVSETVMERLPFSARRDLEPLLVDGTIRWLRAPVKMLLRKAEEVLGKGEVRLGGRPLCIPASAALNHVC